MPELKKKFEEKKTGTVPFASAKSYYNKNDWLQKAPSFTSAKETISWLKANKQGSNSLGYLVLCLWHGSKIPEDKLEEFLRNAGAADHAIKRKEIFMAELHTAAADLSGNDLADYQSFIKALKRGIDRNKFTRLKDDSKPPEERRTLSDSYFSLVFNYALQMYSAEALKNA